MHYIICVDNNIIAAVMYRVITLPWGSTVCVCVRQLQHTSVLGSLIVNVEWSLVVVVV